MRPSRSAGIVSRGFHPGLARTGPDWQVHNDAGTARNLSAYPAQKKAPPKGGAVEGRTTPSQMGGDEQGCQWSLERTRLY